MNEFGKNSATHSKLMFSRIGVNVTEKSPKIKNIVFKFKKSLFKSWPINEVFFYYILQLNNNNTLLIKIAFVVFHDSFKNPSKNNNISTSHLKKLSIKPAT